MDQPVSQKNNQIEQKVVRYCAMPSCSNKAKARGMNSSGKTKYFAWCGYHRSGPGKAARQEYSIQYPRPIDQPKPKVEV